MSSIFKLFVSKSPKITGKSINLKSFEKISIKFNPFDIVSSKIFLSNGCLRKSRMIKSKKKEERRVEGAQMICEVTRREEERGRNEPKGIWAGW